MVHGMGEGKTCDGAGKPWLCFIYKNNAELLGH